jgi:hypothetical protein
MMSEPEVKGKLSGLKPLGQMPSPCDLRSALSFLWSDASSRMTIELVAVTGDRSAV